MKESENILYKPFSHIYVEKQAVGCETAKKIISRFKDARVIEINNYKEVFNRPNQNFSLQKESPSLILAKKDGELVYKGAPFCQSFGNEEFYYTSLVLNCIYDCEYCYLRGMYPSGNIVVFVNYEDFFSETARIAEGREIFLCISYDTDLLGLEGLLGFCSLWYEFAAKNKNINTELRTKCGNVSFLRGLAPLENFIIACTLSPAEVCEKYEKKTASLKKRLEGAKEVTDLGFPLRLSFDPVLKIPDFERVYGEFLESCFKTLDGDKIRDIGLGGFRISPSYIKAMKKSYPFSLIANYPFENRGGACSYTKEDTEYMLGFMKENIKKYCSEEKIYLWNT